MSYERYVKYFLLLLFASSDAKINSTRTSVKYLVIQNLRFTLTTTCPLCFILFTVSVVPFYLKLYSYLWQESPPAWTQEAHRPPRSKCSLWWWWGMGGTPFSLGWGVPHSADGGYPIQSWTGGTPILILDGVPPPQSAEWGTLHPDLGWGIPHPDLGWAPPPPSRPEMGYPPSPQVWTDWEYYLPSSFVCGR